MRPRYTIAHVARVKALYALGMSSKAVSNLSGINIHTVMAWKKGRRYPEVQADSTLKAALLDVLKIGDDKQAA